jgi:hypothetical protein
MNASAWHPCCARFDAAAPVGPQFAVVLVVDAHMDGVEVDALHSPPPLRGTVAALAVADARIVSDQGAAVTGPQESRTPRGSARRDGGDVLVAQRVVLDQLEVSGRGAALNVAAAPGFADSATTAGLAEKSVLRGALVDRRRQV